MRHRTQSKAAATTPWIIALYLLVFDGSIASPFAGDFDGSGTVDFADFFLFADQFGLPVDTSNESFDLNGDDTIGFDDFFLFSDQFGKSEASGGQWIPVPLRSAEQAVAGIAGGEGMQLIYSISYAPSNPEAVYLATDVSQVWKSIDGGATWQIKNQGFLANGGLSLVVHPSDEDIVLVAASTHEEISDELADGIYRTRDGGDSWVQVHRTPYVNLLENKGGVNFAFAGHDTIYAATHTEGLLRSSDGGDSWSNVGNLASSRLLDLKIDPQNPTTVFIASETGLYRYSEQNPGSAEKIGAGLSDFPRALVVRTDDSNIIYASAGRRGVFRSNDGGLTFGAINNGLDPISADTTESSHATYLSMSPVDPDLLYVSFFQLGDHQPYYSRDGGQSWNRPAALDELISSVNDSFGGEFLATPIAPHPTNAEEAIASANGNHVQKTINGGTTWMYSGSGYSGGRIGNGAAAFGWDRNNPGRFAFFLVDYGAVLTEDGGATFRNLKVPRLDGGATTNVGALDPTPGSGVIVAAVGITSQIIAVSADSGRTWVHKTTTEKDEFKFLAFNPQDPSIVYADEYKSPNRGVSWNALSKSIVAIYAGDGNVVYAAEQEGDEVIISKSDDGGATWTEPYAPLGIPEFHEIAVAPNDQDRVYVTSGLFGLFIWDGEQWLEKGVAAGLEQDRFDSIPTRFVAIDPIDPKIVYAGNWIAFRGHSNGIFRSVNSGVDWENITGELGPEFTPWALSVNPHDRYLYVGSSHGTWKLPPPP